MSDDLYAIGATITGGLMALVAIGYFIYELGRYIKAFWHGEDTPPVLVDKSIDTVELIPISMITIGVCFIGGMVWPLTIIIAIVLSIMHGGRWAVRQRERLEEKINNKEVLDDDKSS